MVDNHFSQNIEPANRAFLRDHGVAKKSSEEQADFLDQRERHLLANISAIEASKMDSFVARTQKLLDNTLEKVHETIAAHSFKSKNDLEKENLELKKRVKKLKRSKNSLSNWNLIYLMLLLITGTILFLLDLTYSPNKEHVFNKVSEYLIYKFNNLELYRYLSITETHVFLRVDS